MSIMYTAGFVYFEQIVFPIKIQWNLSDPTQNCQIIRLTCGEIVSD